MLLKHCVMITKYTFTSKKWRN